MAIAVASWAAEPVDVKIDLDWEAVGLDSVRATVAIPGIELFQDALESPSLDALPIEPGKGWIVVVEDACDEE